jgi:hypothetical protein
MHIEFDELLKAFECPRSSRNDKALRWFENIDTSYTEATVELFQAYVLDVLKRIESPYIRWNREENLRVFESGWRENLVEAREKGLSAETLKPRYFRPSNFFRYDNRLITPSNPDIEYDLFTVARHLIFSKYLGATEKICEVGCGSCQNLLMLSELFPGKKFLGLDWTSASSEIGAFLARERKVDVSVSVFDMMEPSRSGVTITPGSAIVTIHALEQIGTNHGKLLSFLLESRPALVVHYEPIVEFYDDGNLLDYLAILYGKKRNYLEGYLPALRRLENDGKIEVLEARRPYLGGIIHESSLVVWRPA